MHIQLLPKRREIGIAPYFWLAYLGFFIVPYFFRPSSFYQISIGTTTVAVFLVLYFRGYWLTGAALWRNALMITALGVIVARHNPGASVFFIYSACSGAGFERPRSGVLLIAVNIALGLFTQWAFKLDIIFLLQVLILPVVVGGPTVYFATMGRITNRLLRKQEEVEHLSKIAERERIARDLHDVLGHTLSVIALKSELAHRLIGIDPDRASQEMREVESTARDALKQVREAIVGYRSVGLPLELAQALKVLQSAGVALDTDVEPLALPAPIENVLSLALREAVTNIVRHARATRCHVMMRQTPDQVRCEIVDDGVGAPAFTPGYGLNGMRERIEARGGEMTIESKQSGTSLTFSLPLSADI